LFDRKAKSDKGFHHRAAHRMPDCTGHPRRTGHRPDLVTQLEDHPLGAALADPGHPGQRGDVTVGQRLAQRVRVIDRQGSQGDLRAHPRHPEQGQEQIARIGVSESVQGLGVLADDHRGDQPALAAAPQGGER
jgi:hypothetical protein